MPLLVAAALTASNSIIMPEEPPNLLEELHTLLDSLENGITDARRQVRKRRLVEIKSPSRPWRRKTETDPLKPNTVPLHADFVENLRRIAEICVLGEHATTKVRQQAAAKEARYSQKWHSDAIVLQESQSEEPTDLHILDEYQLFDVFFERQGLTTMVDLLTGKALNLQVHADEDALVEDDKNEIEVSSLEGTFLPPTSIAVQVLQSVSILLQNVTRNESLYIILSNASMNALLKYNTRNHPEVTTHFVTFLKSLAVRLNAETLQFVLRYPSDGTVDFPLYERALEFCSAHCETMVRVTAMNICLNVLRLASGRHEENTTVLPFAERVVLARYACVPSRVSRIMSPLCTKLAERWNGIDETIREMDALKQQKDVTKEQVQRLKRSLQGRAGDLQDDLLLLDDVFKVGLTVLNEQLIEMMLATFCYPLLLQPILLFCQRLGPALKEVQQDHVSHPFGGYTGDMSQAHELLASTVGPAKAALFTLSAVFEFLHNAPLRRLLFTALFHALGPDTASAPTVRSELEVTIPGQESIRLDDPLYQATKTPDSRTTYPFGTETGNRRRSKSEGLNGSSTHSNSPSEECVFVLSPALAEVLEYRGQDYGLMSRAKSNPYRQALLQCLQAPDDLFDVKELTICLFDAALQVFEDPFAVNVLMCKDMKRFDDNIPLDERTMDSSLARTENDRDLGGSVQLESRHALSTAGTPRTDSAMDVVRGLVNGCTTAKYVEELWQVDFNPIAAHTFLSILQSDMKSLHAAMKGVEQKRMMTASFVATRTGGIISSYTGGSKSFSFRGAPSINDPRRDGKLFNALVDLVAFGSPEYPVVSSAFLELLAPKDSNASFPDTLVTTIAHRVLFDDVCQCLCASLRETTSLSKEQQYLKGKSQGLVCLWQVDALMSLLYDLASTNARALRDTEGLSGIFIGKDRSLQPVDVIGSAGRSMYATVTDKIVEGFLVEISELPEARAVIELADGHALPCVCEAPARLAPLLSEAGAGVVAEGVTWQSLYLTIQDGMLMFTQPLHDYEGKGRVVCSCVLERVWVELDKDPDESTPARRLMLSYEWIDTNPPSLFLFDEAPEAPKPIHGCFQRLKYHKSRLDVWFEDSPFMNRAFTILSSEIFKARASRGQVIQEEVL